MDWCFWRSLIRRGCSEVSVWFAFSPWLETPWEIGVEWMVGVAGGGGRRHWVDVAECGESHFGNCRWPLNRGVSRSFRNRNYPKGTWCGVSIERLFRCTAVAVTMVNITPSSQQLIFGPSALLKILIMYSLVPDFVGIGFFEWLAAQCLNTWSLLPLIKSCILLGIAHNICLYITARIMVAEIHRVNLTP